MTSETRNLELWPEGALKIDWVRRHAPLLRGLEDEFRASLPFAGCHIALSVHLEAKTAYLCQVLAAGGADMAVTGSNVLSTQDDVAAALVHGNGGTNPGMSVYAVHGASFVRRRGPNSGYSASGPHETATRSWSFSNVAISSGIRSPFISGSATYKGSPSRYDIYCDCCDW